MLAQLPSLLLLQKLPLSFTNVAIWPYTTLNLSREQFKMLCDLSLNIECNFRWREIAKSFGYRISIGKTSVTVSDKRKSFSVLLEARNTFLRDH